MRGTAETPDLILSGEIGVNKTVNTESLNIYENGDYTPPAGVDGYNDIHVDVRPVIDSITIRENGTYEASGEVDGYSPVVVNVPQSAAKVYAKNINANGNYYPDAGYDGFSQVSVNVPATPLRPLNVTENGEYNPPTGEGYSKVVVDVPTDPEIESITITENGTYTAPSGVDGYSPVMVNVPQPEDAYYIKDMTPGAIARFDDGADMVLPSLTASIVPVQAGSGDPSPTNVRPITGWTGCEIFDDPVYGGIIEWNQLMPISSYTTKTANNVLITNNGDGSFKLNGTASGNIYADIYTNFQNSLTANHVYMFIVNSTANTVRITNSYGGLNIVTSNKKIVKYTSGNVYVALFVTNGTVVDDVSVYPQCLDLTAIFGETKAEEILAMEQAEEGSGVAYVSSLFPHTYYAYNTGTKTCVSEVNNGTYRHYTIPFTDGQGQSVEVFGGSVDVINGVVTPCPYYASYNGEQLTGEWISDRDVYSPNTTPTTGAQVVNIGATGTTISVHPTSIKSLDGDNNVFASTGDVVEGSYFSETPA